MPADAKAKERANANKDIAVNRKAYHDYFVERPMKRASF